MINNKALVKLYCLSSSFDLVFSNVETSFIVCAFSFHCKSTEKIIFDFLKSLQNNFYGGKMIISGLIIGIIFGFLLKRGRFCPTGTIRDILLEKRAYNFILILALIATQGFIYYLMIVIGIVPEAKLKDFPIISVVLGSFMFGFGAVLTNGCVCSSLIKTGDGRLIGIISILTFILGAAFAKQGGLEPVTKALASKTIVSDNLYKNIFVSPLIIFAIAVVILYTLMFKHYKNNKPKFELPKQYSGLRHIICEKIWAKEIIVILTGALMAFGFYFSNLAGRNGGFGVTTPLLSWFNLIVNNSNKIGWTSMLVLGIISGSFITAFISKELSLVGTNAVTIVKTMIGSVLMGIGAVWGKGCLVGNGLVRTAQFSMRGWLGFIFLILGMWFATKIILMKKLNK